MDCACGAFRTSFTSALGAARSCSPSGPIFGARSAGCAGAGFWASGAGFDSALWLDGAFTAAGAELTLVRVAAKLGWFSFAEGREASTFEYTSCDGTASPAECATESAERGPFPESAERRADFSDLLAESWLPTRLPPAGPSSAYSARVSRRAPQP